MLQDMQITQTINDVTPPLRRGHWGAATQADLCQPAEIELLPPFPGWGVPESGGLRGSPAGIEPVLQGAGRCIRGRSQVALRMAAPGG